MKKMMTKINNIVKGKLTKQIKQKQNFSDEKWNRKTGVLQKLCKKSSIVINQSKYTL